jgi:ribonuclease BN (tRNA processing enzyme)
VPEFFQAVAFRVQYKNKILMYGGDSGFDQSLIDLARNAHIAVLEASISPQMYQKHGPYSNHLSPDECGLIAAGARVKKLVLMHLYDNTKPQNIIKAIRKNFKGELIISQDL